MDLGDNDQCTLGPVSTYAPKLPKYPAEQIICSLVKNSIFFKLDADSDTSSKSVTVIQVVWFLNSK